MEHGFAILFRVIYLSTVQKAKAAKLKLLQGIKHEVIDKLVPREIFVNICVKFV